MICDKFSGKTVALIGAGVSNTPLAKFFAERGAVVSVRDMKSREDIGEERCKAFESVGAKLVLGEGYLDSLTEELIVRSPGIRPDIPAFEEARTRGSVITTKFSWATLSTSACRQATSATFSQHSSRKGWGCRSADSSAPPTPTAY